jgi:hypothetical protein
MVPAHPWSRLRPGKQSYAIEHTQIAAFSARCIGSGRIAQILALALGLAACDARLAPGDHAPFVLTSSGAEVLSDAPPGFEVTLGSKRLRPAAAPDPD